MSNMQRLRHIAGSVFALARRFWYLIVIGILLVVGGGYYWQARAAENNKTLTTHQVTRGTLTKTLNVSGVIDAKQKATLRFAAGGKVVYLGAQEGDMIKKWQTVARIDSADLQKRLQQDLNLYFNQRMDFEQGGDDRQDLAPTDRLGRIAQKDQKTLENSVLSVEIRDIAIRNNTLTSPIAGILVSAPTSVPGVNLSAADAFEVIDPESLVFKAAVDEADIRFVQKGQRATIELDAYPDQQISASVSAVAYRSAQTSKGTVFLVEMPILNDFQYPILERYRLGMNGDVTITVDEKSETLSVPVDAIIERDGKYFVQRKVIREEGATGPESSEEVEVEVGIETDDMVEVVRGLSEGDEVVVP